MVNFLPSGGVPMRKVGYKQGYQAASMDIKIYERHGNSPKKDCLDPVRKPNGMFTCWVEMLS